MQRRKSPQSGHVRAFNKRSFLSRHYALPGIKDLGWTKPHDKTFAVLGVFWHGEE